MNIGPSSEARLDQLRQEAWQRGVVNDRGVDVAGGPIPKKSGYYGQAVVKPPVWTWEVPVYFFVGGIAGMSALIAFAGILFHRIELALAAGWIAAVGAIVSPILLTMDLGRPRLFLNMLRVFKYQSPMSVGAWIVTAFGACAIPAGILLEIHHRHFFGGGLEQLVRILAGLSILASAFWGVLLATYTGVLIGATAIPAWFLHRVLLPIHFGAAGLGSAAGLLELLGYRIAPLNALGFVAAGLETALWIWLELNRHGAADRAVHGAYSGWLIRCGELLTGPLALVLRIFALAPFAAISFLIGALVSRFGWIAAGKVSSCNPEAVFVAEQL